MCWCVLESLSSQQPPAKTMFMRLVSMELTDMIFIRSSGTWSTFVSLNQKEFEPGHSWSRTSTVPLLVQLTSRVSPSLIFFSSHLKSDEQSLASQQMW